MDLCGMVARDNLESIPADHLQLSQREERADIALQFLDSNAGLSGSKLQLSESASRFSGSNSLSDSNSQLAYLHLPEISLSGQIKDPARETMPKQDFARTFANSSAPSELFAASNSLSEILPSLSLSSAPRRVETFFANELRRLNGWLESLNSEPEPLLHAFGTDTAVPRYTDKWKREQQDLAQKARSTDANLVFYGDSITKGMSAGNALKNEFGAKTENFGIVGDSTQHLLWRLRNGETAFKKAPEKAVLLIGANNIGHASEDEIVKGVLANVDELRTRLPEAKLLVLGVLPQGREASDQRRNTINSLNTKIETALKNRTNVVFQNVNKQMLEADGSMSDTVWWRDGLHPRDYSPLFKAIRPTLDKL